MGVRCTLWKGFERMTMVVDKTTLPLMTETTDAYEEAVRHRAVEVGFVPYDILKRMTSAEWSLLRVMTQGEARRLVAIYDGNVLPPPLRVKTPPPPPLPRLHRGADGSQASRAATEPLPVSRTKTPTMASTDIDRLLQEIEHGH